MICKVCNKDTTEKVKIKKGYICTNCYKSLPISFQNGIGKMSAAQIKEAKRIIKPNYSKPWCACGNVGICPDSIQISGYEIKMCDIEDISLKFHPKRYGKEKNTAYGTISLSVCTISPRINFEEPFFNKELRYYIVGKKIYYSYPSNIQIMINGINENIKVGVFNTNNLRDNRKKESNKSEERKESKASSGHNKGQSEGNAGTSQRTEFEEAKRLFEVEFPFTKEFLNKKKKELLKKHHPDIGGDEKMAQKINAAYTLLLKYCSN